MRVPFRGITEREVLLLEGPAGWGEFAPFVEYGVAEAAWWLAAGIEAAWQGPPSPLRARVPVNATVPVVPPHRVAEVLSAFPGCRTVKVKVAGYRGSSAPSSLADDLCRIRETCELIPGARIRCDANGAWSVADAVAACTRIAATVTAAGARLEYVEQPCASVSELARLRAALDAEFAAGRLAVPVPIAADESIRRAEDPLRVARAGAADRAVVKVSPLGGARRLLTLAQELSVHGMQVTVSSALDSAVGIGVGVGAAAALPTPEGEHTIAACGLGTGSFFAVDVCEVPGISDGCLDVTPCVPDADRLADLAISGARARWWEERLAAAYAVLAARRPSASA